MSERRACRLLGQWRGTQRYRVIQREEEDELTRAILQLASAYGRYGYRRITALLRDLGWQVGKDRVQRIWRREGLKVPQKFEKGATLTFRLVQKIGQVTVIVFMTLTPDFVTRSEIFLVLLGLMVRAKTPVC